MEAVNTPQMESTRIDSIISPQGETNSLIQNFDLASPIPFEAGINQFGLTEMIMGMLGLFI